MKRSSTLCSPSVIRVLLMLCTVFTPFLASAQWAAPKKPDQINSGGGVTPKSSLYSVSFTENAGQITDTETGYSWRWIDDRKGTIPGYPFRSETACAGDKKRNPSLLAARDSNPNK